MNRREFIGSALGACGAIASAPAPGVTAAAADAGLVGRKWPGWKKGHFQVHSIYTGVAESLFLVYPDGTSMLLDCGDHAAINRGDLAVPVLPSGSRHAGEWIARYVERVNPNGRDVDYMVVSHFHSDHTGCESWHAGRAAGGYFLSGFAQAAETLRFRKAVDRGWPRYDEPLPLAKDADSGSLGNMLGLYRTLKERDGLLVEKFRLGAEDQFRPLRDESACGGFSVRNICANGKIAAPDGTVRDLYAERIAQTKPGAVNENGMSLGMIFTAGKFRLFTAGDFSDGWRQPDGRWFFIEDALAEVVPRVQVAKINHHGHHAVIGRLAAALSPQVWFSCVWDQLHNTADTMEAIAGATAGRKLYCPGILPAERRWQDRNAGWMKDVAEECFQGCHVVVDVAPGGEEYDVAFVAARDESMKVCGVRHFTSREP